MRLRQWSLNPILWAMNLKDIYCTVYSVKINPKISQLYAIPLGYSGHCIRALVEEWIQGNNLYRIRVLCQLVKPAGNGLDKIALRDWDQRQWSLNPILWTVDGGQRNSYSSSEIAPESNTFPDKSPYCYSRVAIKYFCTKQQNLFYFREIYIN